MWNWLVGGLATGSSIFLFDGSPTYPKIDTLLEYCQNKKINLFGVSAKYIDHLKNEKFNSKYLDLSSIKIITSTGSPLSEETFEYVYNCIKKDVQLASIAGGTDLVGCLILGNIFSNVYKGEIQGQSLGIDVDVFTEDGKSTSDGKKGELVVKQPFPSMPVKFWRDPDGKKYHKAYFTRYKNSKPYSYIKSNHGKVLGNGDEYSFSDNVVLTRVETTKKKEMKLFTDQLDILPNIDIILTKKPVKIIQEPSIEIYGVGMKYDNKEGILKLLNNVRVHYDNPRKNSKIN